MEQFIQQVATGLATGSIYALLALAVVLIYRSTEVVNFAQGEMAMLTTFIAWTFLTSMNYWLAFLLTFAVCMCAMDIVTSPFPAGPWHCSATLAS